MIFRVVGIIPAAILLWYLTEPLARPWGDGNWLYGIAYVQGWWPGKIAFGLLCFGIIIGIIACFAMLYRRSLLMFLGVTVIAYLITSLMFVGYKTSHGTPMDLHSAITLIIGMISSVSMCFFDVLTGKQVDIVGDDK